MESNNIDDELQKLEKLSKDTAVGDTMYDKKSVIEKILEVGKHFQQTSYIRDEEVLELETGIEEKLCTLWDISVEEDVSQFYYEHGVLDIFVELFNNPNNRVKEIAVGIMSNMVYHQKIFRKIMEKDKYLESCTKLLEEKDSPILVVVFRCLHSYGFNLFNFLNAEDLDKNKEGIKHVLNRFLVYLSLEGVVNNIGVVIASCTNKEVLLNAAKFLSIFAELWENSDERNKVSQFYAEEQFLACVLESMNESVGEDKTEKHLAVFLNIIYENDADKDLFAALSDKVISISNKLLRDHVLQYHSVEDSDLEFIYNLVYLIKVSLNSGGFVNLTNKLLNTLHAVSKRLSESNLDEHGVNISSVTSIISGSVNLLESLKSTNGDDEEDDDDSCSTTSRSSAANSPRSRNIWTPQNFDTPRSRTFETPQAFDTPQSSFNTPRQ